MRKAAILALLAVPMLSQERVDLGMQASAVIATLVYQTAMRKEILPRRELPKPE
jgi:hypothetical protein